MTPAPDAEAVRGTTTRGAPYRFELYQKETIRLILILYLEAWSGRAPIWAAMKLGGEEVRDPKQMPKGAFRAMERAAD